MTPGVSVPPHTPELSVVRVSIRRTLPLLALVVVGCQPEAITSYRVPRTPKPPPRLLGAILPVGDTVWFLKLTGAAPEIAAHATEFEQFVRSLHFTDDTKAPLTWTLPTGWRDGSPPIKGGPAEQMRFATFRVGPEGLKLTISRLGKEAADVLPNVNRWRRLDLELKPITEAQLPGVIRKATVDGKDVTLVDMTGGAVAATEPDEPPPAPPAMSATPVYDVPAGWQVVPVPPGSMRVAAFKVADGDKSAEVTIIPLAGQGGGLLANINRWSGEVGLPNTTEADLRKEAKMLDAPGGPALYVDLVGAKERTLGAILLHGGKSWFVKLRGPTELIGKQQAAFEAFVKSMRFDAGAK
jgi:hypothetical protein